MRCLGIDYGIKRIGTAVADEETRIAVPRDVILRVSDAQAADEIRSVALRERIEKIIVGLPLGLDGAETEMSAAAREFGNKLGAISGLPVEFENEIYTTRMTMHAGIRREDVDAASAAIILQSYLDKKIKDKR